ncbi:hypothetical protein PAF17_14505 [Paracoccus sp. Z330]|uniref:Uncharacterized protein n=1 Tax=Paracoccus onchidii TaxID=3017813 RepID=A0ABT4ZH70_9RHOB|nr:hypothetical protein [Paracoccus onchidii]MDB6178706.1 hypothetical protein [Paracoccus onchidii]
MEEFPDTFWPSASEDGGAFASMDMWFALSFVMGLAVLMVFSWRRLFNEREFDINETSDRLLSILPPGTLRGTMILMRAYLIYLLIVGTAYTVLSLGGAYVLQVAQMLRIGEESGLNFLSSNMAFDDPAWPLAVSLAFVGLADTIPKLNVIERHIRRLAHRSIGIPPLIRSLTRTVLQTRLDRSTIQSGPRAAEHGAFRDLLVKLQMTGQADKFVDRLDRIALLGDQVLGDQAPWPSSQLRTRFDLAIHPVKHDIDMLFSDIDGLLLLLNDAAQQRDGPDPAKTAHLRRQCQQAEQRAEMVDRDLSMLIAIFAENEPLLPEESKPLLGSFVDRIYEQRDLGRRVMDRLLMILGVLLVMVWLATFAATRWGANPVVGPLGVTGTATYLTMLMLTIYAPSALIGLSYQQARLDRRQWRPVFGPDRRMIFPPPVSQYGATFLCGYVPVLLLLAIFFAIFFLVLSNDFSTARQQFLLFLPVYAVYAAMGGLQSAFSAFAQGESRPDANGATGMLAPLLHAALAVVILTALYEAYSPLLANRAHGGAVTYWFLIFQASAVAFLVTLLSRTATPEIIPAKLTRAEEATQ